jgi:hypothetical protein
MEEVAQKQGPEPRAVAILIREDMLTDPEALAHVRDVKEKLEAMGLTVFFESEKAYMARGRVLDCDCALIQCVCTEARKHKAGCQRRLAMTCAIPISCDAHGRDICEECDPCSCERP